MLLTNWIRIPERCINFTRWSLFGMIMNLLIILTGMGLRIIQKVRKGLGWTGKPHHYKLIMNGCHCVYQTPITVNVSGGS